MDGQRFDGIARQIGQSLSRRGMMGLAGGAAAMWLASPEEVAARRHACQVRCGGDKRLCKAECRNAPIEKQCKKTCDTLRNQCFGRCEFKPLRRRLVRAW